MLEQIQPIPPPYDVLASFDVSATYTKTATSQISSSAHAVTPAKEGDTVTLSALAQANQLYLQGDSVLQIAALLGLPTATVDSDLNIKSDSATTPQAVQAVAGASAATLALPSATLTATSAPYTAPAIAA